MDRAARESMDRKAARLASQQQAKRSRSSRGGGGGYDQNGYNDDRMYDGASGYSDMNSKRNRASSDFDRRKKSRGPLENIQASSLERSFFERVKQNCDEIGPEVWNEFVQCLSLYNSGVLEQADLLLLVAELLSKNDDLYDEFKVSEYIIVSLPLLPTPLPPSPVA